MRLFKSLTLAITLICVGPLAALTFFDYDYSDSEGLKGMASPLCMNRGQLQKWDGVLQAEIEKSGMSFYLYSRIYTYLYVAQSDAATLIGNAKGGYVGSFDPVSEGVIKLFFPDYCRPAAYVSDLMSETVAEIVVAKVKARVEEENKRSPAWKCPKKCQAHYKEGLNVAQWKPWFIDSPKEFWPAPPPTPGDAVWQEQLDEIRKNQCPLTKEKLQAINWWAGNCGFGSGSWTTIANRALFCGDYSICETLRVRAILNIALYDGQIVCMGAKYHYMVDRPQMRDPTMCYVVPAPAHPSYPAGHSVEAGISQAVLSALLPQQACYWQQLAYQAGISRIWAGIHYPLDDAAGDETGKEVGEAILEATR